MTILIGYVTDEGVFVVADTVTLHEDDRDPTGEHKVRSRGQYGFVTTGWRAGAHAVGRAIDESLDRLDDVGSTEAFETALDDLAEAGRTAYRDQHASVDWGAREGRSASDFSLVWLAGRFPHRAGYFLAEFDSGEGFEPTYRSEPGMVVRAANPERASEVATEAFEAVRAESDETFDLGEWALRVVDDLAGQSELVGFPVHFGWIEDRALFSPPIEERDDRPADRKTARPIESVVGDDESGGG